MDYLLKSDLSKKSVFSSDVPIEQDDFITLDTDWTGSTEPGTYKVIRREFIIDKNTIKEVVLHFEKITGTYNSEVE